MSVPKRVVRNVLNGLGYDVRRLEMVPSVSVEDPEVEREVVTRELLLPEIPVSDVMNGTTAINILEPQQLNGNVTLLEMLILNTLVANSKPRVVFEIGTFDGRTTLNLAANAGPKARTFTLDLPLDELSLTEYALDPSDVQYVTAEGTGQRFKNTSWASQITQLFGDSAKLDFSPYFGTASIVFIDGSHSYDYVKNDSHVALRLLKRPGVIVWHDYDPFWTGVVECLEELRTTERSFSEMKHITNTALALVELHSDQ